MNCYLNKYPQLLRLECHLSQTLYKKNATEKCLQLNCLELLILRRCLSVISPNCKVEVRRGMKASNLQERICIVQSMNPNLSRVNRAHQTMKPVLPMRLENKKKKQSLQVIQKNKTNVKRQEHLKAVLEIQVMVMAVAVLVPMIHLTQPQQHPTKGRARQRLRHRLKQKLPSLASVSRHPRTVLLHLIGMLMLVNEPKKVKV